MMDHNQFLLAVVIILSACAAVDSIRCYKCDQVRDSQRTTATTKLCSRFDYSDEFVVDCPYSTMCVKTSLSVNITGQINVTSRGCALQKYVYQKYDHNEKRWNGAVEVQEAYDEGCLTPDSKGLKISTTRHCFCRGDLCNGATTATAVTILLLSTIMFITVSK